jgi:hypothetical protein
MLCSRNLLPRQSKQVCPRCLIERLACHPCTDMISLQNHTLIKGYQATAYNQVLTYYCFVRACMCFIVEPVPVMPPSFHVRVHAFGCTLTWQTFAGAIEPRIHCQLGVCGVGGGAESRRAHLAVHASILVPLADRDGVHVRTGNVDASAEGHPGIHNQQQGGLPGSASFAFAFAFDNTLCTKQQNFYDTYTLRVALMSMLHLLCVEEGRRVGGAQSVGEIPQEGRIAPAPSPSPCLSCRPRSTCVCMPLAVR